MSGDGVCHRVIERSRGAHEHDNVVKLAGAFRQSVLDLMNNLGHEQWSLVRVQTPAGSHHQCSRRDHSHTVKQGLGYCSILRVGECKGAYINAQLDHTNTGSGATVCD